MVERAVLRGRDTRKLIQVQCPTYDQAILLIRYLHTYVKLHLVFTLMETKGRRPCVFI